MKLRFLYKRISWPCERLSAPQEGAFSHTCVCLIDHYSRWRLFPETCLTDRPFIIQTDCVLCDVQTVFYVVFTK